ncbi:hypothetical protein GCM10028821_38440 [Hymenobacter jeollabukensis]
MTAMPIRINFLIEEYQRQYLNQPFFALMIDGDLQIWLDDQLYFQASIALVEFAFCLNQWLTKAKRLEQATPLAYYTIDHDEREGALLRLTPVNAAEYTVESIWQEFECRQMIRHQDMKAAVETYFQQLDAAIRGYGDTDLATLLAPRL